MKDGDSGKILWLNQNSDFSKSNIEHEARIPKKILKVGHWRQRAVIEIQNIFRNSVLMKYFSAKAFVANSISHLLKKSRHLVLCKEYFSSKYKIFIAMNRQFTEVDHGGNLEIFVTNPCREPRRRNTDIGGLEYDIKYRFWVRRYMQRPVSLIYEGVLAQQAMLVTSFSDIIR